ncbi:hypothetical protein LD39_13895, partial [Halobacillus sp. BBL2006]
LTEACPDFYGENRHRKYILKSVMEQRVGVAEQRSREREQITCDREQSQPLREQTTQARSTSQNTQKKLPDFSGQLRSTIQ